MVPEEYICAKCQRKKAKATKQAIKIKSKREKEKPVVSNNIVCVPKYPPIEHPKPVATIDLLLSVAESRTREEKTKVCPNLMLSSTSNKLQSKGIQQDGVVKKAIVQNGFVYLCRGRKIEDCNLKLKYSDRNIFEALFADFSPKTSK